MKEAQRKGLFVGSFDPFTIGHDDIVRRALGLFDGLIIGVGTNPDKAYKYSEEERINAILTHFADEPKVEVIGYSDFAIDLAKRVGAKYIVRGVRSIRDFEYERDQAVFNKRLGDIETILLYADPTLSAISSSAVRELEHFNKDASWMIPKVDNDEQDE